MTDFTAYKSDDLMTLINSHPEMDLRFFVSPREGESFHVAIDRGSFIRDLDYFDLSMWDVHIQGNSINIG